MKRISLFLTVLFCPSLPFADEGKSIGNTKSAVKLVQLWRSNSVDEPFDGYFLPVKRTLDDGTQETKLNFRTCSGVERKVLEKDVCRVAGECNSKWTPTPYKIRWTQLGLLSEETAFIDINSNVAAGNVSWMVDANGNLDGAIVQSNDLRGGFYYPIEGLSLWRAEGDGINGNSFGLAALYSGDRELVVSISRDELEAWKAIAINTEFELGGNLVASLKGSDKILDIWNNSYLDVYSQSVEQCDKFAESIGLLKGDILCVGVDHHDAKK